MILATDVHYAASGGARAAGVAAESGDAEPAQRWVVELGQAAAYVPGSFADRELPCLLSLLQRSGTRWDAVLVDGNAWNAPGVPGLGARLWDALDRAVPVVGVAKRALRGVVAAPVHRGASARPLFVTAAGMPEAEAAALVHAMAGEHRRPALVVAADRLARDGLP